MRIVLIHPPSATEADKHWASFPVLGLAYIAASLRVAGHEVTLIDGKLRDLSIDEVCEFTLAHEAELIGISAMTIDVRPAKIISSKLKARKNVSILIGGAHANAVGGQILEEVESVDFACVGEGEETAPELIAALEREEDLSHVHGIAYRDVHGTIRHTRPRPYPKDYDRIPFPAWDLFEASQYIPIVTHRGCPFRCTFCGHNSGFKPRFRSPENVLDELRHTISNYQPRTIRFEDETFGLNMRRTKQILQGIIDEGLQNKVSFSAQTRVDRVDGEFMHLLKMANFETLELGVESGNAEMLQRIQKGITLEQVEHAVKLAKANDLRVWCKFIIGHPNETPKTAWDTVNFITKLNPDRLSVSIMTPYPGTPIHKMALNGEGGYKVLTSEWSKFDKYTSGALELEGFLLGKMKRFQIYCYLKMYVFNFRILDLLKLLAGHRKLVLEMVASAARETVGELRSYFRLHPKYQ